MKVSIKQHELLAEQAAQSVEKHITGAINTKGVAHIILATGSSQLLFLKALRERSISWEKVVIFIWTNTLDWKKAILPVLDVI